ncbi:MAG TPA: hypothetical protein VF731_13910 [Solirubrobacterales bacterium]
MATPTWKSLGGWCGLVAAVAAVAALLGSTGSAFLASGFAGVSVVCFAHRPNEPFVGKGALAVSLVLLILAVVTLVVIIGQL